MVTDLPVDFVTQAPLISNEKVLELLLQNFGIKSASITPLSGYDDLNFRLENVTYLNDEKYGQTLICKFTNPIEARYPDLLDSQVNLMVHLKDNGIPCATVLPSVNGKNYEFVEMVNGIRLPLRCFTLLPGKMMQDVGYSNELYFKVGQLMAKFHNLTTNYSDDKWFRVHRVPITLECWDYLENEFKIQLQLGLIKPENAPICEKIFRDFNSIVIQNRHQFEEGIIHSDFNESNILFDNLEVSGLIDFGDTHHSLRIFDVAAGILYIIMDVETNNRQIEWPLIIENFLNGYRSKRELKQHDLSICQISMCARLIASLIYGLRTCRLNARGDDPSYILKTQRKGWEYLHVLTDETPSLFSNEF